MSLRHRLRTVLLDASRLLLAHQTAQTFNRLLYDVSLRGMGILNYKNAVQSGERYLLERLALAVRMQPLGMSPPIVLDVGAHVGAYTEMVLDVLPHAQVHAFEAHPGTAAELAKRLAGKATTISTAIGAKTGEILTLHDYEDSNGSSHASLHWEVFRDVHRKPHKAVEVNLLSLDDYLRDKRITDVLLLKIDTEGHEFEVLRGAKTSLREGVFAAIQFEFTEIHLNTRVFVRDFISLLEGYDVFRLLPRGLIPINAEPRDEIFAYQNLVAIRCDSRLMALVAG